MLVFYSGYGYWNDCDGRLTRLIRQSGIFELQFDDKRSIEYKKQTTTHVLDACFTHEQGAYPPGYIDDGDRYFFEIFKIDGKGGEFPENVLFTSEDIIEKSNYDKRRPSCSDNPKSKEATAPCTIKPEDDLESILINKIGPQLKKKYPGRNTTDIIKYAEELKPYKKSENNSRYNNFLIDCLVNAGVPRGTRGQKSKQLTAPNAGDLKNK